jgi:hypothetical protein
MNEYFKLMLEAKKSDKETFVYKSQIYVKSKTPSGMITYKKQEQKK